METFTQLFGDLLAFVYHCFDRIVIYGYLSGLSRPEQVVHFFRNVVGVAVVDKEVFSRRTADYQAWVEAFARNHRLPIEWAEKGVRKEDHVLPWQRRMARDDAYGVYFIFKSMEQGPSFRVSVPKYATKDPNYRILARQRSRFTHYYFYLRDETLGPMMMRVASFFPFQTTYYLNGHSFIEQELKRAQIGFRKTDNAFLAVADVAALQAAADRLSPAIIRGRLDYWTLILGPKFSTKERKQLNLSRFYAIAQIEYCRNFIFKRNFPIHKLFERGCELKEPIYIFNNSWYVRAPLIAGGRAKFRAWNNATEFCDPKAVPPGMCIADFETKPACVQSPAGAADPFANRFPVGLDRVPFFDCFAASPGDEANHGISNHPDFPDKLAGVGFPFAGWHGDPGFVNAHAGDFRLRPDSLAWGKACVVTRRPDGSLVCASGGAAADPDVGAYQGDALVEGPEFIYRGDEQPRVMKTVWRTSDGAVRLEIAFSTPCPFPDLAPVNIRSGDGRTQVPLISPRPTISP